MAYTVNGYTVMMCFEFQAKVTSLGCKTFFTITDFISCSKLFMFQKS